MSPALLTDSQRSWNRTGVIAVAVRYALVGTVGALGPWATVMITKPKKVTISGLTMPGVYQFQIHKLGSASPDRYAKTPKGLCIDLSK
jgi:hypothetical protein